jgi:hypothetical protein
MESYHERPTRELVVANGLDLDKIRLFDRLQRRLRESTESADGGLLQYVSRQGEGTGCS